jgi:hypothetical protein
MQLIVALKTKKSPVILSITGLIIQNYFLIFLFLLQALLPTTIWSLKIVIGHQFNESNKTETLRAN